MENHLVDKFYLAPFQGITDFSYRNAFVKNYGCTESVFAPYIAGTGPERVNPSKLADVMPSVNTAVVVPQVLSKDAAEIVCIAKALSDLGYTELNWNLGCPFPQVARKKRGAGLLQFPEEIAEILDEVVSKAGISISVKTRLGYTSKNEIFALMDIFNDYPLKYIIIHARTALQMYSGKADPLVFSECVKSPKHELWYNGDVFSLNDYLAVKSVSPETHHFMLGRGALMNPVLPVVLTSGSLPDEAALRILLNGFLDDLFFGLAGFRTQAGHILNKLKQLWMYLSFSFADRTAVIRLIRKCHSLDEYHSLIRHLLENEQLDINRILNGISDLPSEVLSDISE
jgi:tRNA-dihydrouridine synthase